MRSTGNLSSGDKGRSLLHGEGEKGEVISIYRPAPEARLTAAIAAPRTADTAPQPVPARSTLSGMILRTANNRNKAICRDQSALSNLV